MQLSTPPRVKVLEAVGAVAGARVKVLSDAEAEVRASEGDRTYRVFLDMSRGLADSDDNGTRFRNYIGYPILAFMMVKGILPYDEELGRALKDVKWRSVNELFKNYRLVERYIKEELKRVGVQSSRVDSYIAEVMGALSGIALQKPVQT
ncbi:MAG: hypothetical protein NZ938_03025 [Aigarchaeota archaeon]|nr:hypothetical protein [Candidatus Calditenuaceae archaeon]